MSILNKIAFTLLLAPLGHLPPEHEFRVLGNVLLHQVIKQCFQNVSEVLQLAM